jgi:hypothetical protein
MPKGSLKPEDIVWTTVIPPPRPKSTENELYGDGWVAERTDSKCILDSMWGGHGGGSIIFEIDDADFELLKSDLSTAEGSHWATIYKKYSYISGDSWWADRTPDYRYVRVQPELYPERYGDFHITEEEFVALRKNGNLFPDLYKKYYDAIKPL